LSGGRNLDQIQIFAAGQAEGFERGHHADLFTFIADHANFARPDTVIGSDKTFVDTVLRALRDWEYKIIAWGIGPKTQDTSVLRS
jgi:hypothetical protein